MEKTPGVRVPAPIFNRRRPRQALFAHPNNSDTGGDGPSTFTHGDRQATGMGSIQPGTRGSFNPSYQSNLRSTTTVTSQQNLSSTASSNQYPRAGPPANPRPPSMRQSQPNRATSGQGGYQSMSGPSTQNQNAYNSSGMRARGTSSALTGQQNDSLSSYRKTNNYSLFQPSDAQQRPGGRDANNYTGGQSNYFNNSGQHFDNGNASFAGVSTNYGSGAQSTVTVPGRQSGGPGSFGGDEENFGGGQARYGDCPARQGRVPGDSTSTHDYSPQYGQQPWGNQSLPTAILGQNNTWTPTPLKDATSSLTVPDSQTSTKTVDKSLHFITASIQGVKHWNKFTHKISMLFEIFGTLNSAVSTSANQDRIKFVVKDDKDSLTCIFFQIDRQIPRLVRTQWHRCVGTFDEHANVFRCVSVRPAEQAEIKLYKNQVTTSDRTMRELVTS